MELEGGRNASTAYLMRKGAHVRIRSCHIAPTCHGVLIHYGRLLTIDGARLSSDFAQIVSRDYGARGLRFQDSKRESCHVRSSVRGLTSSIFYGGN
jgi:hypothetical protein